jgi:hypothetical protein
MKSGKFLDQYVTRLPAPQEGLGSIELLNVRHEETGENHGAPLRTIGALAETLFS